MKLADAEYDRVMHIADVEYDYEIDQSQERASFFSLPFLDVEAQEPPLMPEREMQVMQVQPVPQYAWLPQPDPAVVAANQLFDQIDSNHDGVITRQEFGMYRQTAMGVPT